MTYTIEPEIQRLGRAIFEGMEREAPSVFRKDYWNGKIMDWSMRDEAFKVEMFRFVDVFPVLHTPEQVARHIQEYFCRPDQDFPAWIQLGLKQVSPGSLVARTAAKQIEKNIRSMAGTFVAGVDADDALPKLEKMRKANLAFTVDLLGEATVSEAEAHDYQERYLALIRGLCEAATRWSPNPATDGDPEDPAPRVNVSVKLSALYSQIDPIDPEGSIEALVARMKPLYLEARERGAFLNLDMESYELKDLTLATFRTLLEDPEIAGWTDAGCVIQAYLRDSLADAKALAAWARERKQRITVRLVKGAYWDYETIHAQQNGWPIPVYQQKWETDANYEACLAVLLDAFPYVRVAVASHNVRSLAAAMAMAKARDIPQHALEVQMLYGMAEPLKKSVQKLGYRLRDYVPVGELVPGMAYLVRRLLENTSNEGFLRAKFHDDVDPDVLLRVPAGEPKPDPAPVSAFYNEQHGAFFRAEVRTSFGDALDRVGAALGGHVPCLIGGEAVDTAERLASHDPSDTSRLIGTTACADEAIGERAIRAAYAAFGPWRARPQSERSDLVRRVAAGIRARRHEIAAWMVYEVGKNWREADADVAEAIDFCEYYAACASQMMDAPTRLGRYPGELNQLMYQPMGVGAVIAPWNFPFAILTGMTIASIVTGNCVVIKPAEQSPMVAARLVEVIRAAGIPDGVVNYCPGRGEQIGAWLVRHPWTRFVAFTGSREVGLDILRAANTTHPDQPGPKRVVCEMGGKNAIIVDDDADLDEAVHAVVHSAFGFQGQKCSACSRAIVLEANYDAFVARLVEAVRSLEIGPARDARYAFGPVVDGEAADKVRRYIAIGHEEGELIAQAPCPDGGHFVPFSVFAGIRPEHRLAQEEIFGPVLAVMRAADFDEALSIANGTSFALTGGIISRSPANLERARREFRVGNLYINRGCTGALVYRQPFGGFKYSGLGHKAGGPNYLHQFVEERAISENTMRRGFAPES